MSDLYHILGLSKTASQQEIKAAYRKLAKQYHPDMNPKDEKLKKKFQEISTAYKILSDPSMRKRYDQGEIDAQGNEKAFGFHPGAGQGFQGGFNQGERNPFEDIFSGGGSFNAEDIFSGIFGGRRGARQRQSAPPQAGQDVHYTLKVSFLEAAQGTKKRITLEDGRSVELNIPSGTLSGKKLRLKHKGHAGQFGGPSGDAYVQILVAEHPYFELKNLDIYLTLPIRLDEAVLGAHIGVPTIHGEVKIKVPPQSSSGKKLRLKGKGIHAGSAQGDQYIVLQIMLPPQEDAPLQDFCKDWRPAYNVRKFS